MRWHATQAQDHQKSSKMLFCIHCLQLPTGVCAHTMPCTHAYAGNGHVEFVCERCIGLVKFLRALLAMELSDASLEILHTFLARDITTERVENLLWERADAQVHAAPSAPLSVVTGADGATKSKSELLRQLRERASDTFLRQRSLLVR
eukprot:SAG11_NODE_12675_length_691_cov_1.128378_1_plen_148_part_00